MLPPPPPEIPAIRTSVGSAPKFAAAVNQVLAGLADGRELPFEWLRTPERQAYLYGFGREYDDGRGIVTNAQTALWSWHGFGLACDVVEKSNTPWGAPPTFWNRIGTAGEAAGLVWGGRWHHPDLPHLQWAACPVTPTDDDRAMLAAEGVMAVWAKYDAI